MIYSTDFFLPILFVFCIHMFGTYYIMHLTMVFIMDSYIEAEEVYALDEIDQKRRQIKLGEANLETANPYFKNREQIARILEKTEENIVTLNWREEDGLIYRKKDEGVLQQDSIRDEEDLTTD